MERVDFSLNEKRNIENIILSKLYDEIENQRRSLPYMEKLDNEVGLVVIQIR